MSDPALTEEPVQFGEGGRLSGILTLSSLPSPTGQERRPAFVFLNAGLLHRVGPHRLYVRLARKLSSVGFHSLRVDLAGKGDSVPRRGLTHQQSVAADYEEILRLLESRLGRGPLVLAGLCSGADDATRLASNDSRVVGLVLLDPVCPPDAGFSTRAVVLKYANTARYILWLKRRFRAPTIPRREDHEQIDPMTLRDSPTLEQLRSAFASIRERDGRVLSVFTQYAHGYYNQEGQLGRVLGVDGYPAFCTEIFWPDTEHTYTLDVHRRRLIGAVSAWAGAFHSLPNAQRQQ